MRTVKNANANAKNAQTMSEEELKNYENLKAKISEAKSKISRSIVKSYNTGGVIVVATAVQGARLNIPFIKSIERYIKVRDADLVILPCRAHQKALSEIEYPLDDYLLENYSDHVYKNVQLKCKNSTLTCLDMEISPTQANPLGGLSFLPAALEQSFLLANPQRRFQTFPNSDGLPRAVWTTGAITDPTNYRNTKAGLLAEVRHVVGALVVEISPEGFFVRNITADKDGSFVDLGKRYSANKVKNEKTMALIRGDEHIGFHDETCHRALDEITDYLKPREIYVHDIFEGASVSHHRAGSAKARSSVPSHMEFLDTELAGVKAFLVNLKKKTKAKIYVVGSNHNEHLDRWIAEGRFLQDCVRNMRRGSELLHFWVNFNRPPLQQAIDPNQKLARWLKRGDIRKVEGVVVSTHGDKGMNGSRGSINSDTVSFTKSTAGHSHSPQINNGNTRVGTSTRLDMDYTIGSPSSWLHASEAIYKSKGGNSTGSQRQLICIINGRWSLIDGKDRKKSQRDKIHDKKPNKAKPNKAKPNKAKAKAKPNKAKPKRRAA
jgi:hypothetical protein